MAIDYDSGFGSHSRSHSQKSYFLTLGIGVKVESLFFRLLKIVFEKFRIIWSKKKCVLIYEKIQMKWSLSFSVRVTVVSLRFLYVSIFSHLHILILKEYWSIWFDQILFLSPLSFNYLLKSANKLVFDKFIQQTRIPCAFF